MTTSSTAGRAIGSFLGATGAHFADRVVRGAEYAGNFSADIVHGMADGYEAKNAELQLRRQAARVARLANAPKRDLLAD